MLEHTLRPIHAAEVILGWLLWFAVQICYGAVIIPQNTADASGDHTVGVQQAIDRAIQAGDRQLVFAPGTFYVKTLKIHAASFDLIQGTTGENGERTTLTTSDGAGKTSRVFFVALPAQVENAPLLRIRNFVHAGNRGGQFVDGDPGSSGTKEQRIALEQTAFVFVSSTGPARSNVSLEDCQGSTHGGYFGWAYSFGSLTVRNCTATDYWGGVLAATGFDPRLTAEDVFSKAASCRVEPSTSSRCEVGLNRCRFGGRISLLLPKDSKCELLGCSGMVVLDARSDSRIHEVGFLRLK